VKTDRELVDHLAWALAGLNVYGDHFRASGDVWHAKQALAYARRLDAMWQDLLERLERTASEPMTTELPTASTPAKSAPTPTLVPA
jgi:hypothetical protein